MRREREQHSTMRQNHADLSLSSIPPPPPLTNAVRNERERYYCYPQCSVTINRQIVTLGEARPGFIVEANVGR